VNVPCAAALAKGSGFVLEKEPLGHESKDLRQREGQNRDDESKNRLTTRKKKDAKHSGATRWNSDASKKRLAGWSRKKKSAVPERSVKETMQRSGSRGEG